MSDEKYPIVEVTFQDITTFSTWNCPEYTKDEKPILCKAVGYLVEETDSSLKVVFLYAPGEKWADRAIIPKGAIVEKRILG